MPLIPLYPGRAGSSFLYFTAPIFKFGCSPEKSKSKSVFTTLNIICINMRSKRIFCFWIKFVFPDGHNDLDNFEMVNRKAPRICGGIDNYT